ncbi:hypothetical protein [Candidatus Pyrohabitans sp.]
MRLKGIACISSMCSGSTSRVKIYFEEGGSTFYWDELFPHRVKRSPTGRVGEAEVKRFIAALRRELSRQRFTSNAYYLRKALKELTGR